MTFNLWKPFLLLTALLIILGVVLSMSYQPQDFAEMRTQDALQGEALRHAEEVNRLGESNLSNAYTNTAMRRQYWTLAFSGLALGVFVLALFASGGVSAFTVAYTSGRAYVQIAEAKKRYKEVMNRPDFYHLPDGRTVFETRKGTLMLLDKTGAAIPLTGQTVNANPELVQVILAQIAAGVAVEQSKQHGKVEIINR